MEENEYTVRVIPDLPPESGQSKNFPKQEFYLISSKLQRSNCSGNLIAFFKQLFDVTENYEVLFLRYFVKLSRKSF